MISGLFGDGLPGVSGSRKGLRENGRTSHPDARMSMGENALISKTHRNNKTILKYLHIINEN